MKRSMSSDKLKHAKVDLNERLREIAHHIAEQAELKQEHQPNKYNMINAALQNPGLKKLEEDAVSSRSKHSVQSRVESESKMKLYVQTLKSELEKEKSAKNNALNILKGLKHKDHEVEKVIQELKN